MSNFVACSSCGKRVSNVIGDESIDIVVRAYVECPECIEKLPDKEPGMVDGVEYDALKKQFEDHTRYVSQFLSELHATMVDPLAEGIIKIEELCPQLLERARKDRQTIQDMQDAINQIVGLVKTGLEKFDELLTFVTPFVPDTDMKNKQFIQAVKDEIGGYRKLLEKMYGQKDNDQTGIASA